ncbi:hypothetical protein NXS19_012749 [Fusarium pseudograminearum]|nr:hypothetical protein NXS19_012749 [Fusarium pseudograminearum]
MDEVIGQGTNGVVGAESVEANKETELLDDLSQQIRGTKTTDWLKKTVNQFRRIHHARRRDKDFADATESQYNILRTDFIVKWHTMYYGLMGFLPVPYNQDRETLRHADLDRTGTVAFTSVATTKLKHFQGLSACHAMKIFSNHPA